MNAENADTAWNAGRLDSLRGPRRLLFGQMYEDAEVEREIFRGKGRIFSIASAGDTAMLLSNEHEVVACDINPVQLAYAERRANGGRVETGDAERVMRYARSFMPLVGWREKTVQAFLELSDVSKQPAFWRRHLDTWRFRSGFDVLMSRAMLRAVYSPQFLLGLPSQFGTVMRKRLEQGFARHANASNPYIHALLLGEKISAPKAVGANIQFVAGDAASVLEACPPASFAGFTLSNILDGATAVYSERLKRAVRRAAGDDAVVALRSFAEPSIANETNRAEQDRAMLWGVVEVLNAREFY